MSFVPAQNVTAGPIVIDDEGRTLGGGEWGPVDRHDPHAQQAIGDARIAIHPDLDPDAADLDAAAVDAYDAAQVLEERRVHLTNLDVDQLRTLAASGGLDDVDEADAADHYAALDKTTLRHRLTRRTDISLTSSPAAEPDLAPQDEPSAGDTGGTSGAAKSASAAPASAAARKSTAPRGGSR